MVDKRLIGMSSLALGALLASLAVYYFGASSGQDDKATESIGSKIAAALACLLLMGGGALTFIAFKDRAGPPGYQ